MSLRFLSVEEAVPYSLGQRSVHDLRQLISANCARLITAWGNAPGELLNFRNSALKARFKSSPHFDEFLGPCDVAFPALRPLLACH